ncbi:MAG: radical SAM protein, partial [Clostridiales bacterium]|nr:radical SAM protein [Clostridiales bacterium]
HEDIMRKPYLYTPAPDRTLLQEENWAVYLENFKKIRGKIYSKSIATGVTTMNAARGCVNNRRRCAYCGIGDLHVYQSPAYRFWEDIMSAKREIKANFFYECCDNFTYSTKYLKEICYCRPNNLDDVHLIVYSSADCVNQMNCDLLKELGVYLVNLGLDAGDAEALSMLKGNNVSVEENYFAVDMLTKKNLEMHISFVLMGMGSNGRTRKSLDKTMEFIRYLVGNTSVTILDCALFYPDRMAPVGGLIWTPENYRLYKESYHLDYIDENYLQTIHDKWKNVLYIDSAEITRDFARLCGTDCELLLEYQQRIKDICEEYNISFGYSQAGRFGR